MLRPTAKEVCVGEDYTLKVLFDNGEKKIFDVKPYIRGTWYGELRDPSCFRRVYADGFTVAWPDGQDLCPDELYELSRAAE